MKHVLFVVFAALLICAPAVALADDSSQAMNGGPGLYETLLYAGKETEAGVVRVWNTSKTMIVQLHTTEDWLINESQIYVGADPIPTTKKGDPEPKKFPFYGDKNSRVRTHTIVINLKDDLGFSWGNQSKDERIQSIAIHAELVLADGRQKKVSAWAYGPYEFDGREWGWWATYELAHPMRGQFIDSPVIGLGYHGPTQHGVTGYDDAGLPDEQGGFLFFPSEEIEFSIGTVSLGNAEAGKKVSPLDLFSSAGADDSRVVNVARLLQSLDDDHADGKINIRPVVAACLDTAVANLGLTGAGIDWASAGQVEGVIAETIAVCNGNPEDIMLTAVSAEEAQANLEAGLNASGIFRKNISKTEDWGEKSQKLEVMPVYIPGLRSDGTAPVCCIDDPATEENEADLCTESGIAYEEWRTDTDGDGMGNIESAQCDPRVDANENGTADGDDGSCVITTIECRDVAKPLLVTYLGKNDIYDDQVTTDFWPGRFSWDVYTAVSRDDGTTWKRMNVSRMADMSSFDLETGEPFPGTSGSPYLKINDNKVLVVWESKFCKSGNPRYSITNCALHPEDCVDLDGDSIPESICRMEAGEEVCAPDNTADDAYYVTDIWGVRGQQQSVNYDEVDDVAELGIGEIPYSCLWAARGVVATEQELEQGTFDSMTIIEDNGTPDDALDDYERAVVLGDIVWYKPERITSGRRDVYIPMVASARGAGFAIAWQEDPSGLRPGKGKGPGEGWSGAISNHKTDIWYSYISYEDFDLVDVDFLPGGPPEGEGPEDKPGLGRPKALVPFSLPVRISDNDMVNTDTLKVAQSSDCVTPPDGTESVCFPEIVDGTFSPIDPEEIAIEFCDHPDSNPDTCCDPDNHTDDLRCEDLKGLYGNLTGTKRYAYQALTVDDNGDGLPDYQYYQDNGGTLDLCDTSGSNTYMDMLPGTDLHERWFGFANVAGDSKLVCVASDGRLLDGDVSASRPMLQLQPYTKKDGTKSAWALLAYEESKGLGHSLAAEAHLDTDNPVDEIIVDKGQEKPTKQDIGKNLLYHSFDFAQPDLVAPGHMVNLPALCGGLYPTYCDDPENPTCSCEPGEPVPLYFDYWVDHGDGTGDWMPDDTKFLQYRTEIARRARFIAQSPGRVGDAKTLGAIIFKQGQEGQGRPADVFIRRIVKSDLPGNPYQFGNFECTTYLDETFDLPSCPNDSADVQGYNCNVWGEATGDRLCGGTFTDTNGTGSLEDDYVRRDHVNLTSHDIDASVPVGLDDLGDPDDPTDDIYARDKVLLWSQHPYNLGNESYGEIGAACTDDACPGMYSNARSHRGFIRGDVLVTAFSMSPNWAAGRNGNDRYNFYVRRSFDGGQTWTTNPDGDGVYICPEYRTDPTLEDPDGTGNLPPGSFDASCGTYEPVPDGELPPMPVGVAMTHYLAPMVSTPGGVIAQYIGAGVFEPARNVSEIGNNKESSGDPRVGTTPPTYPLDGTQTDATGNLVKLCPTGPESCTYVEDEYVDNVFFVAWGTVDNPQSTGSEGAKPEGAPLDLYYTRSEDYGDNYLKIPWVISGVDSNLGYGETVWRYPRMAWGEPEEQGEAQLRATSDGSKVYAIYHSSIPEEEDPDAEYTRWYPWRPETTHEDDLWFRRVIFWPDQVETVGLANLPTAASITGEASNVDSRPPLSRTDLNNTLYLPLVMKELNNVPAAIVQPAATQSAPRRNGPTELNNHLYLPMVLKERTMGGTRYYVAPAMQPAAVLDEQVYLPLVSR